MDQLTGSDALLLHMERGHSPMHTLKIAILDPSRRGRQITLEELAVAVGSRLGIIPRATQLIVAARGFGGRPFWVEDPYFKLADHLEEVSLPAPGSMEQFDDVCSELAGRFLPRDRPLWSMSLVHGLAGGRQAVVVRVHHAVTDGLGALNMFMATTGEHPGETPPVTPPATATDIDASDLSARARQSLKALAKGTPRLLSDAWAARKRAKQYRSEHPDLPPFLGALRNSLNVPARSNERMCATGSIPLADVKAVGRSLGATVNGVLHALFAGAIRSELAERGEAVSEATVGGFAIASDKSPDRVGGNYVNPVCVSLASHLDDPLKRLQETARSCKEGVELRHLTGIDLTGRWAEYGPRVVSALGHSAAPRKKMVASHIHTANVPGPSATRWLGDVEVVDWFSFALALSPSAVNLTTYSYDGRLNMGLVVVPDAMPDPHAFLRRVAAELEVLREAVNHQAVRVAEHETSQSMTNGAQPVGSAG